MTDTTAADQRPTESGAAAEGPIIRPFRIEVPEEELAELHRRLVAVRLPSMELVNDRSQGVQLATVRELPRYWSTEYDWRA